MKILFISMPSIHFVRWAKNIRGTGKDLYWFDILNRGYTEELNFLKQITNWKKRKIKNVEGEYFLSNRLPKIYNIIQPYIEVTVNEELERILNIIQPDIVHSFEMQSCSHPILEVMNNYPSIKWIYSCWGSDLFYYQNQKKHKHKIKAVLKRVDSLHTDSFRDYMIAKKIGFKGLHTGVIPGGGGYRLEELKFFKKPINERRIILVKGYEHEFGRAINAIKALDKIIDELNQYELVIFGAHEVVIDFIKKNNLRFKFYHRNELDHRELLELLGSSLIYIGNSISDGIPNTLLEAIIMGAFPIQSNPGGVTSEIVIDNLNGALIEDPNDIDLISDKIFKVLKDKEMLLNAIEHNIAISKEKLSYKINQNKIIALYQGELTSNLNKK